jgi:hypothetical protein
MLPILRVIPVGGVLLAIAILVLALNPPDGSRAHLTPAMAPARGALIARDQHPEWRQFLMLAALRRADELKRLLELPDTPLRSAPAQVSPPKAAPTPEIAAVPNNRSDTDPEDLTGSIVQTPDAAIPVDIGETSSTELPVIPQEERPPVVTPERAKRQRDGNAAPGPQPAKPPPKRTARRAKPVAKQEATAQFNFFEALFGGRSGDQPPANVRRLLDVAPASPPRFGAQ